MAFRGGPYSPVNIEYHSCGNGPKSSVANYTKTLIVSGITNGDADSHLGLEDLGEQPRGPDEGDEEDAIPPDIQMEPDTIRQKVHAAFSHFVLLEGFEWYGRFAGDYHLARYLQQTKVIRHLAYGIDMFVSSESLAYFGPAFMFEGLETLAVTSEYEPTLELFYAIAQMMHRNPDLRSILFDCKFAESMSGQWSLVDLICDTSLENRPVFVWPNLSHLVLRFWKGELWKSAEQVELLTKFLVDHPGLETLILQETCLEDSQSETAQQLSLSPYPNSLPVLERLIGSPRLIAGVLESKAACSSVKRVVDNSEEGFDQDNAKIPYIDRIMGALANAPKNQVNRLRLEVPQLDREFYARIARVAPQVRFLEFLRPFVADTTTPNAEDFSPQIDIPDALKNYPNLEIIGGHIVKDFAAALECDHEEAVLALAKQVPAIQAIHEGDGRVIIIHRDSGREVTLIESPRFLNNDDFDWVTFDTDWRHRLVSRRELKRLRGLGQSENPSLPLIGASTRKRLPDAYAFLYLTRCLLKTKSRRKVDALIPEAESLAQSADAASTSRLLVAIVKLCRAAQRFDLVNSNITLLAKKHGQLKAATQAMVEEAMTYLPDLESDRAKWLELIEALRSVTEGKTSRARVTLALSLHHERLVAQASDPSEALKSAQTASDLLSELQVETYSSMTRREKTEFLLEQMRLLVLVANMKAETGKSQEGEAEWIKVRVGGRKVNEGFLKEAENEDLKLKYYELMIKYALHNASYLDAAKHYYKVWETPSIKAETEGRGRSLMRWPGIEGLYGAQLRETSVFGRAKDGEKRWEDLHMRVIELTGLLDLPLAQTEETLCKLVVDGSVWARIDRPKGIVNFRKPRTADDVLNAWSADVSKMMGLVEKASMGINAELAARAKLGASS
ncbi:26S proteasome non-ATPase regulatory subunit 12 [Rhizoctonia solani AG-1 IA]|uniref:26S proteasome non-ATPase regulatory subunit 12 n=1 Tax=Thanatephorus cucumeris (strain AG1-IA) TaxID=983506 RepID=L8WW18_THACA|nr:26S proteasome non-ATPase regulatory subunit 12 [Rhizoctonia solani AG-1 IA]